MAKTSGNGQRDEKVLPPSDVDAERAFLGSLMIDPEMLYEVDDWFRSDYLYNAKHRLIYEVLLDIHLQQEEAVDFVSVSSGLRSRDELENVGGEAYLIGLLNSVPTSVNCETYGKIVQDRAIRRRLIHAASRVAKLCYDGEETVETIADRAESMVLDAANMGPNRESHMTIRDALGPFIDRVQDRANSDEPPGIPTGFRDLDRLLGGLKKQKLLFVAGRPGMGKTSFMLNMMEEAAMTQKKRIALFSMEMSPDEVLARMVARESKINTRRLEEGDLKENEWSIFYEVVGRLGESQIFIDITPSLKPSQIRARCRRLYARHGLDMIMVDYLQLMYADSHVGNRVQEISEITRALKNLARELNVPVVCLSQLSRAVESRQDKRPQLSDLRDSGSIEQDADVVMFLYRDEYYNPDTTEQPNIAEINVAKHRNGPTGVIDLFWDGSLASFRTLQRQEVLL